VSVPDLCDWVGSREYIQDVLVARTRAILQVTAALEDAALRSVVLRTQQSKRITVLIFLILPKDEIAKASAKWSS